MAFEWCHFDRNKVLFGYIGANEMYMAVATLGYLILCLGLFFRKERNKHVLLMSTGIVLDLSIVLTLEIKRNAIKTAMALTLSPLQQCHILASTVAVLIYFPVVYLGATRLMGRGTAQQAVLHKKLGLTAFVFRSVGFVLMFSLLWKKHQ